MMWWIWIIIAIIVIYLILLWSYHNLFVSLSNRIQNSFAQIDVQLKKRADLVPNLVETVKGYAKHEKGIMTEVTSAHKALVSANASNDMGARVKAGDALQNVLGRLFALGEAYPNLKANENFLNLQQELAAIEDKVAYSRQFYNDSILRFDNAVKMFPGNMFAGKYKDQTGKYIKIPEAERQPVKVKF